jgi:hypothetical protein
MSANQARLVIESESKTNKYNLVDQDDSSIDKVFSILFFVVKI